MVADVAAALNRCLEGKPACFSVCSAVRGQDGSLDLCACHKISYCGRDCQRKGWRNGHKDVCGLRTRRGEYQGEEEAEEEKKKGARSKF